MNHRYTYITNCVGADGDDINEMKDMPGAQDIDCETFFNTIGKSIVNDVVDMFALDSIKGFIDDWYAYTNVGYYQGLPCVFLQHSGVEHVFVQSDFTKFVRHGDEIEERREAIEDLDNRLDDCEAWQDAKTPKEWLIALSTFVKENIEDFKRHNILLGSVLTGSTPYAETIKQIDMKLLIEPMLKVNDASLER